MSNAALETAIEAAWETRDSITPATKGEAREAIETTLTALDSGVVAGRGKTGGGLACQSVGQESRAAVVPADRYV